MRTLNVKIILLSMVVYFVGCAAVASIDSQLHGGYSYERPKSFFEEKRKFHMRPDENLEDDKKDKKEKEERKDKEEKEEKKGKEEKVEKDEKDEKQKDEKEQKEEEKEKEHVKPNHHHHHHHHHHHSSHEYLLPKYNPHSYKVLDSEAERNSNNEDFDEIKQ